MQIEENYSELTSGERLYPKHFQEAWLDHQERYFLALQYAKPDDLILDAATGCGYGVNFLAKNSGCKQAIGLDISEHAIKWANKYFGGSNIDFIQTDITSNLNFLFPEKRFDLITSFETIEHLEDPIPFLKSLFNLLNNDGKILLSTPNEDTIPLGIGKNPHHFRHYTSEQFQEMVRGVGFYISDCYTQSPNRISKGIKGFYNVLVCTKIPTDPISWSTLDRSIEELNSLRIQEEYPQLQGNVYKSLEFVALDKRIKEIFKSYNEIITVSDLFNDRKLDEMRILLDQIDKSLCPEAYFWYGLMYQIQGEILKSIEIYCKILSNSDRFSDPILTNTKKLLKDLLKENELQ